MKIPIENILAGTICQRCDSYKGIIDRVPILTDLSIVNCVSSGEQNDENCKACSATLNYVHIKYGSKIALLLSEWFSK